MIYFNLHCLLSNKESATGTTHFFDTATETHPKARLEFLTCWQASFDDLIKCVWNAVNKGIMIITG